MVNQLMIICVERPKSLSLIMNQISLLGQCILFQIDQYTQMGKEIFIDKEVMQQELIVLYREDREVKEEKVKKSS